MAHLHRACPASAVVVIGLCVACHAGSPASAEPVSARANDAGHQVEVPPASPGGAEPVSTEPIREELAVEGAFPLLVWAPAGREKQPLIVSAHGAGCMPEDHCAYLWELSKGQAIVACLPGEPLYRKYPERGFYFKDHLALARELEAAMLALEAHFGARLSEDRTYVGYSQGATMGALLLPDSPRSFRQLLFIEGGGEGLPRASAQRLKDKGTERVLFACGTSGCKGRADRVASLLQAVGIDARVGFGEGAGHTYLGAVETTVLEQMSWLWPAENPGKW
jgi:predicted esterase